MSTTVGRTCSLSEHLFGLAAGDGSLSRGSELVWNVTKRDFPFLLWTAGCRDSGQHGGVAGLEKRQRLKLKIERSIKYETGVKSHLPCSSSSSWSLLEASRGMELHRG